jgi:hypothetical protein
MSRLPFPSGDIYGVGEYIPDHGNIPLIVSSPWKSGGQLSAALTCIVEPKISNVEKTVYTNKLRIKLINRFEDLPI